MGEMNEAEGEDIFEDEDADFERTFSTDLMVFGFDALWCADYRLPCLVRVVPSTLRGSVFLHGSNRRPPSRQSPTIGPAADLPRFNGAS